MSEKCTSQVCGNVVGPRYPELETPITGDTAPGCSSRDAEGDPLARPGNTCPDSSINECSDFTLEGGMENCFIDDVVNESLKIGGATLNVYKLLGVHEQSRLVDCTGHGLGISGGELSGYPASNAFTVFDNEWRSIQRGSGVVASAYIGYDFGEIKTNDFSREAYGTETYVMKHISAIKLKQSSISENRVTEARIERSSDGRKWYGVARVALPDDDCLNTVLFGDSVPSRFWRIRPIKFNGGNNDRWAIKAMEMFHDHVPTDVDNIQDKVFLENRDRDYDTTPEPMKGYYDLYDAVTEVEKIGISLTGLSINITVSFSRCVQLFNRPIVIGDIIEIPAEAMYSAKMRRIEKWLEVIDVAWSTEGYTPGWNPTMLRLIVQPAFASQETQDIFGDMATYEVEDGLGLVDQEDGKDEKFQDYFDATQTMVAEARDAVPQRGREGSSTVRAWEEDEIAKSREPVFDENGVRVQGGVVNLQRIGLNPTGLYVEDGMPPNNAPFTEADEFPETPNHGDYHRLTYSTISTDIPARLYRYSETKGRWVFLEKDVRKQYSSTVPMLAEFTHDPRSRQNDSIMRSDPLNRQRIRKSCDVEPQYANSDDPPETKDGTVDFKVTSRDRADNTLKPMEEVDPTADNPSSCPNGES